MPIAADCETTGIDKYHGSRPFAVTICNHRDEIKYWIADVDPMTRKVLWDVEDLVDIDWHLSPENPDADEVSFHNSPFDVPMIDTIIPGFLDRWDWTRTQDTQISAHLVRSNDRHDLTSQAISHLGIDIKPLEEAMDAAIAEARRMCRLKWFKEAHGEWALADEDREDMPSAGGKVWKADMWLPKAVAKRLWMTSAAFKLASAYCSQLRCEITDLWDRLASDRKKALQLRPGWEWHPPDLTEDGTHHWWTVLPEYMNADSAVTLPLRFEHKKIIDAAGISAIHDTRLKLLPIITRMERDGITLNSERMDELEAQYEEASRSYGETCVGIARERGCDLVMPAGGVNKSLMEFVFGEKGLCLPPVKCSKKTGAPSFDKHVIEHYLATLDDPKALLFMRRLSGKRSRDSALSYMRGYRRFWIPLDVCNERGERLWYLLNPRLNPTGTHTLRWSSSNPNSQNISKKEEFNLRYMFGPGPGREWWSCDAQNIELRIPAYESGEQAMIDLFEQPDVGPYYGSNHLLVAHVLHPAKFEACRGPDGRVDGRIFKKLYESTWYKWVKNGNFAVQYGAQEFSGTADLAYHVKGAQRIIASRFTKVDELNRRMIAHAEKYGYVETIPDKSVCPDRGYPVYCRERGYVKPTVPLSYHVQSTAMWWMGKAMIRVQAFLDELNSNVGRLAELIGPAAYRLHGQKYKMVMQIHDELVFDFPRGDGSEPHKTNRPVMREIQRLMEMGGDDISIPTPTSCEYHSSSWSVGMSV